MHAHEVAQEVPTWQEHASWHERSENVVFCGCQQEFLEMQEVEYLSTRSYDSSYKLKETQEDVESSCIKFSLPNLTVHRQQ